MTLFLSETAATPSTANLESSFFLAVQRDFAAKPAKPQVYVQDCGYPRFWAEIGPELVCGTVYPNGISVSDLPGLRKEWKELEESLSRPIHLYFFIPRFDSALCKILEKEAYYAARFATTGVARSVRVLQYLSAGVDRFALQELSACTIYARHSSDEAGSRRDSKLFKTKRFSFFVESKLSEDELGDFLELGMEMRFINPSPEVNGDY